MNTIVFKDFNSQLNEVAKPIKFGRKAIVAHLQDRLDEIEHSIRVYKRRLSKYKQALKESRSNEKLLLKQKIKLEEKIASLNSMVNEQQAKLVQLRDENSSFKTKVKTLESEKLLMSTKFNFISRILSTPLKESDNYKNFKKILWNDFIEFANSESSLAEEASAILKLQQIDVKLNTLVTFNSIYNKTIIAVGGGFSAGKSEFISSFFLDKNVKLPIDIKPSTSIPTYITPGETNKIKGHTNKGGVFEIDIELFARLSHDFINSFSFDVRELLPLISIETPIDNYKHIAFVDTPGYNPSSIQDGFTSEDIRVSKEYLQRANALIWIIGLDSNGTISSSDIDFINQLSLGDTPLYIVANKADLRSEDDVRDILDEIEEELCEVDISYHGISAFSSINRQEYEFRSMSLYDYLKALDKPNDTRAEIISELNTVFDLYKNAMNTELKFINEFRNSLKSLELDILEVDFDGYSDTLSNRITTLRRMFDDKIIRNHLARLNSLREQVIDVIDKIFSEIG